MRKFSTLQDAIALAEFAHRNQLDKAGMPFIDHPKRVLASVQAQGVQPYVQIAAILHDVVEDTPFTIQMLQDIGFSEAPCLLVELLTRTGTVPEMEYYKKIADAPAAKIIKLADIRDNLTEWRLSYLKEDTQIRLRKKYAHALEVINGEPQFKLSSEKGLKTCGDPSISRNSCYGCFYKPVCSGSQKGKLNTR